MGEGEGNLKKRAKCLLLLGSKKEGMDESYFGGRVIEFVG